MQIIVHHLEERKKLTKTLITY